MESLSPGSSGRLRSGVREDGLFGCGGQKILRKEQARDPAREKTGTSPKISIVVPHFNHTHVLEDCLSSLQAQSHDNRDVEILVVDNGSEVSPDAICAKFGNVTFLEEEEPGPGPARNKGIAASSGNIVVFLDADCTAHPDWLAKISEAFSDPGNVILGGDVRIPRRHLGQISGMEAYESIYAYRMAEYIRKQNFTGTGNLAVRRHILEDVGPFSHIGIAEDRDWGHRATKRGYTITYVPEMIVYHPARETFLELTRKWDRQVAHDYEEYTGLTFGKARWFMRVLAVAGSPIFEIRTVLTSPRISGGWARLLAFLCLVRIRLYRSRAMVRLAFDRKARLSCGAWHRLQ